MNNVQIYLKEYGFLDGCDDISIPLVLQISDVQDISKRKSNFSKTISIPGTANNNKIFSQAFDIKKYGGFSAVQKHGAVVYIDNNMILDGYLLLNEVIVNKIGDSIDIIYNVNIYDEVIGIFDDIKNKNIRELDFSQEWNFDSYKNGQLITTEYLEGEHTFTDFIINNSISNSYVGIYTYPQVNYNWNNLNYKTYYDYYQVLVNGETKRFPYEGTSAGFLYPAVYIKAIIDRIFYEAGYTYDCAIFNDQDEAVTNYGGFFSKLVNIYNLGKQLTNKNLIKLVCAKSSGPAFYFISTPTNEYQHTNEGWYEDKPLIPFSIKGQETCFTYEQARSWYLGASDFSKQVGSFQKSITKPGWSIDLDTRSIEYLPCIDITTDGTYTIEFHIDVEKDYGKCILRDREGYWLDNLQGLMNPYPPETYFNIVIQDYASSASFSGMTNFDNNAITYTYSSTDLGNNNDEPGMTYAIQPGGNYYSGPYTTPVVYDLVTGEFTTTGGTYKSTIVLDDIELKNGDMIYVYIKRGQMYEYIDPAGTIDTPLRSYLTINKAHISLKQKNKDVDFTDKYGSVLRIGEVLPDINQADFLKSFIEMFNLYITNDVSNSKKLIIKNITDFYSGGTILNWSDKVDYSEKHNIKTILDKLKKVYRYKYSDDDVDLNLRNFKGNSESGLQYGERKIDLDNNYIKNSQVNESIYRPYISYTTKTKYQTISDGYVKSGVTFLQIPNLVESIETTLLSNLYEKPPLLGIVNENKMIFYSGSTPSFGKFLNYISNDSLTYDGKVTLFNEVSMIQPVTKGRVNSGSYYYTTNSTNYNSLTFSDIDLSVDLSGLTVTQIFNLYDKYHRNQLLNIIDQEARELELYIHLSVKDISSFNFRNRVQIEGQNYFVQKINYDPTSSKPSKVLLLKETVPIQVYNGSGIIGVAPPGGGEIQE